MKVSDFTQHVAPVTQLIAKRDQLVLDLTDQMLLDQILTSPLAEVLASPEWEKLTVGSYWTTLTPLLAKKGGGKEARLLLLYPISAQLRRLRKMKPFLLHYPDFQYKIDNKIREHMREWDLANQVLQSFDELVTTQKKIARQ